MQYRNGNVSRASPMVISATPLVVFAEREFGSPQRGSHDADDDNAVVYVRSEESVSAAAMDVAAEASAAPASFSSSAAADPLLILLSRPPPPPPGEVLHGCGLALVGVILFDVLFALLSGALHLSLHQNGHLVFFGTFHSRSYLHPHPSSLLTGRPAALHASLPSKPKRETDFGHWETASKATGTTAGVQVRDTTARRGCNGSAPAAGIVPLPVAHLPFKKVSTAALKRHQSHEDGHRSRSSCLVEREIECAPWQRRARW
ncbi:conserved hypothetical protein [Leishmania braziliensis MHOM/BR/75/M2904]|uniref:Uncharacterized protein n=1 Tax=Leishmania braziliensis TaxID=5660 RepID=A4HM82_LEIBR|nr:conserved hypothetical protein [Leishmania braziliensis MHOM/BR/75/M2904]CAM43266.1 conserved hypothetical protein [Leishmania braziliensis MHOM/BR/75/M2904]